MVVCSAGPARVTQVIREALARGADRAIHVESDALAEADAGMMAAALAGAIRDEGFDLVLTGLQSDDHGFGQTGVVLAERLGLPHATIIMEVDAAGEGALRVKRELESGWFQWVTLPLPALLTIQSGINQLRYATLRGIMAAKRKEIRKVTPESADALAGQRILQVYAPGEVWRHAPHRRLADRCGAGAGSPAARGGARPVILVIGEQRDDTLNPATWETVAAAQQITDAAAPPAGPVKVVLAGSGERLAAAVAELAAADVDEILSVDQAALEPYTADGFTAACAQVVEQIAPDLVIWPHTYQTRDYAPALAARLGRLLIPDCIGAKVRDGATVFVRPMFQGKFVADVAPEGPAPHCVSIQIGAYRADSVRRGDTAAAIRTVDVSLDRAAIRQQPEAPFKEAKQAVDLTQADRIVAVGRGIKDAKHLPLVQELARALDAEVAASRPICDAGWLPMDRQIGSSGQTVAPALYLALGISGAIQHLVGMKGARTIVAVNKDADAPIFEVAHYGIVGDLFEIVPAIQAALEGADTGGD